MMGTLLQDLRYGARALLRSPGFTLVAVLTLALGIGANTTIFSLTNGVFLRPVGGVGDPGGLVRLHSRETRGGPDQFNPVTYPDYLEIRALSDVFAGAAAYRGASVSLGSGDRAEMVQAELVTGGYFGVLGVRPALGRGFLPEEEDPARGAEVAVISHDLWRTRFASDPAVVGKPVVLNGRSFTVVGVAPQEFVGTEIEKNPEVWVPLSNAGTLLPGATAPWERTSRWLRVMARLRPGVDAAEAQAAAEVVARRSAAAYPETHREQRLVVSDGATLVEPVMGSPVTIAFTLVTVMVGLVLLIACANVANLLLARASGRRREIAVRLSLGAGRGRIVRQLLTESFLLALLGGAAGLAVASLGRRLLPLLRLPPAIDTSIDVRVLAYVAAVSVVTPMLFGLAPALNVSRPDLVPALKDGTTGGGRTRSRLRGALVVSQIAVSLVMLLSAGLLLRTLYALRTADPGFDVERVLTASLNPGTRGYEGERLDQLLGGVLERARTIPGVEAATASPVVPLSGRSYGTSVTLPESEPMRGREVPLPYNAVQPDYFRTLGIPLARGRPVTAADRPGTPRVAVVNEAAARRFWPGEDPLGKHIRTESRAGATVFEVVGVARDAHFQGLTGEVEPMMFTAFAQQPESGEVVVQLRAAGDPGSLAGALRREVRALDPDLPVGEVRTLREVADESMIGSRLTASLLGVFGALALLLASVGLSGVVAYAVTQRTHEIGVRIAMGAAASDVLRLVVGQGMRLALVGVAVGAVLGIGVARLLASQLYGVGPSDPLTFLGVSAMLMAVALLASWLPARRAVRVDPVVALRND